MPSVKKIMGEKEPENAVDLRLCSLEEGETQDEVRNQDHSAYLAVGGRGQTGRGTQSWKLSCGGPPTRYVDLKVVKPGKFQRE